MMAGLVGYGSSDDEGSDSGPRQPSGTGGPSPATLTAINPEERKGAERGPHLSGVSVSKAEPWTEPTASRNSSRPVASSGPKAPDQVAETAAPSAIPFGPLLPPGEGYSMEEEEEEEEEEAEAEEAEAGGPGDAEAEAGDPPSPKSANRAIVHNLTLPSVPNFDIPSSPPGSPPARVSQAFEQFLELKKKGTHFNAKLEQSTALRNPSVMDKLMQFVELEAAKQYETTLSPDLWNPEAFPEWAFGDRLLKSREKAARERDGEKASSGRSSIDFVAATTTRPGGLPAPGGLSRSDKVKGSGWK